MGPGFQTTPNRSGVPFTVVFLGLFGCACLGVGGLGFSLLWILWRTSVPLGVVGLTLGGLVVLGAALALVGVACVLSGRRLQGAPDRVSVMGERTGQAREASRREAFLSSPRPVVSAPEGSTPVSPPIREAPRRKASPSPYQANISTAEMPPAPASPPIREAPPVEGLRPDRLIAAWEEYRREGGGHFKQNGLQKFLDQKGITATVSASEQIDAGESVLFVKNVGQTPEYFVLPSFQKSPQEVAVWFDDCGDGRLTSRVKKCLN